MKKQNASTLPKADKAFSGAPRRRRHKYLKKSQHKRLLPVILVLAGCIGAFGLGTFAVLRLHNTRQMEQLSESVRANTVTDVTANVTAGEVQEASADESRTVLSTVPAETTEPAVKTILPQYAQLYQENPDLFGWIKIDETIIDYPVMHTPDDPEKYLRANFDGAYSTGGLPFMDAACSENSDNLLIYGHNMHDGSMFRTLLKYESKDYWEAHPIIRLDTLYEEYEYEVLAAFYDRVYYKTENVFKFYQFIDAENSLDFDNAIANFKSKQLYDTGVSASYGDKLITLVTCSYHTDNGRFVVVARRKTE